MIDDVDDQSRLKTNSLRRRLPIIRSTALAESGLASLAMISSYWGRPIDVGTLRQRFAISSRNSDITTIVKIAEMNHLSASIISVAEIDALANVQLPAVLYWSFDRFVVLRRIGRRLVVHDPGKGVRRVSRPEAERAFTGVAIELAPSAGFYSTEPIPEVTLRSLIHIPPGLGWFFSKLVCIGVATQTVSMLIPILFQWGVDNVATTGDLDLLNILCVTFLALSCVSAALAALRGWSLNTATTSYIVGWKSRVFRHMTALPVGYFNLRRIGEITSRFDSIEKIVNVVNDSFIEGCLDSAFGVASFAVLWIYNSDVALLTLAGAALYTLVRFIRFSRIRMLNQENIVAAAKENSTLIETIKGISVIKLFCRERDREREWMASAVDEANTNLALSESQILFRFLSTIIGSVEQIVVFWVSIKLIVSGKITIGMYIAIASYRSQFYGSVSSLVDNIISVKMLRVHAARVSELVSVKREDENFVSKPYERIGKIVPEFELRAVSFGYSEVTPLVVQDLSLRIRAGESVAIVGRSGCGKSSLIGLLLGFNEPVSGTVLFGGIPLSLLPLDEVRRVAGVVIQNDMLFVGSIAQNISSFDEDADQEWVAQCATIACIDKEIERMPMGYGTLVSDGGGSLSGGQKQRICIARAIYRRPLFLIMDEATNQLDIETENEINRRLNGLEVTRIIVAHRIDTIRSARRIVRMSDGRVVDDSGNGADYGEIILKIGGK